MDSVRLEKVTAFITRAGPAGRELLLFRHPNAGIQLPAGTVEVGETPEQAVLREAAEESGLANLRMVRPLGSHEQVLPEPVRAIVRTTIVYSRPDVTSFDWARIPRGSWVHLERREAGFAQVTYTEWDQWPERNWATYRITGWVPEDAIGRRQRRSYFHLEVDGAAPDAAWTVAIDNHRFQLFWAPLDALPRLVEPQNEWLEHVWKKLLADPMD